MTPDIIPGAGQPLFADDPGDGSSGPAFPIVGVGASAGGIEALEGLFRGIPERPGFAMVIVTHLNPQRGSVLHEIIARYTSLDVRVAVDGADIEIDSVHVLPADAILGIRNGRLSVTRQDNTHRERKPIDVFFSALAIDHNELAAGIVLSGGDGDGTIGIKAIKERGGLTLAQIADGTGPQHPSMPESAISTGMIDFAIPVEEMGAKLAHFARSVGNPGGVEPRSLHGEEALLEDARHEIYAVLRSEMGHDFAGYKIKTFARRVQRRMQIVQLDAIESYLERLRRDPQEVAALFRDLLINVTNFFRDGEAFEALAEQVIPKLFEGRSDDDTVRLWVPGCSTGEEVFSLAILVCEHLETLTVAPRVQLFATDIDEHALTIARAARYPAALLDNVSGERKAKFFVLDGSSYLLNKSVRDLCVFSPHSVIRDPPFSQIDLISCRNLLIYFGVEVQNQVLPTFHYALRPGGYLFLGTSENIGHYADMFGSVDKKQRIFRSRAGGSGAVRLPLAITTPRWVGRGGEIAARAGASGSMALRQAVEAQVLERFSPAHVVVNRDGDVVFYSARTGKYLEAAAGQPTRQILTMARKGLRLDLYAAFREAVETSRSIRRERLAVEGDDGRVQRVTLTVDPLRDRADTDPLFLILFEDEGPTQTWEDAFGGLGPLDDGAAIQLERELRDTRERLQSMIEEYETAIEELKSSNEELVSVNEEVQSSNEELEASKEELQSLNEELHTVNAQLTGKIDALDLANSDLQNLFDSADLATVFLDSKLVIRSFTPSVTRMFNILPGDRGRPITDLASRVHLPGFIDDLSSVLRDGKAIEHRVDQDGGTGNYLMRLSAYRDLYQSVEGVVVTFVDITTLARAETRQAVLIAELQHRTRNLLAMVQAIAVQTLGKGGSMESYMHRLSALGRVQSLISKATNEDVDLGDIVRLELQAHVADDDRITVTGPPVTLRLEQVQTFALALHELATNALKHGALKVETGRLAVTWSISDEQAGGPYLVLDWIETGVTILPEIIERRGYGRQLIERALSFALRADTRFLFGDEGVSCRIVMPLKDQHG
ncbi:chemotaxis protein CheR [Lichenicola cladoniae]|uniref:histidine kinase n=1 Tax=Lichenicola cladoniae TaxID=1484109 RepID=A0A6M8HSA3_9PROT|nr:CheR family methyltransferase [Lichenicola cladoniae]NPD65774.1 chemotaxis protein CheR [Acetobacteraceae bacterium]QKE91212.1 chemotaxis protein CheR [Lichenicola cladoniae]